MFHRERRSRNTLIIIIIIIIIISVFFIFIIIPFFVFLLSVVFGFRCLSAAPAHIPAFIPLSSVDGFQLGDILFGYFWTCVDFLLHVHLLDFLVRV